MNAGASFFSFLSKRFRGKLYNAPDFVAARKLRNDGSASAFGRSRHSLPNDKGRVPRTEHVR